ncbi:MAG TPA: methyltransferase domain-containing protein [Gammaproteobacteria bacterium]
MPGNLTHVRVGRSARSVEPEWLDELPAADPRAIRSRRDLQRVNAWMLNARIMGELLESRCGAPPRSIVDLGGGDGTFLLKLARRLSRRWPRVSVTLVDRQPVVSDRTRAEFRSLGWDLELVGADALAYLWGASAVRAEVVTANLFLHHLDTAQLERLFALLAGVATLFVACEPRRSAAALAGSRLLWAIGCNDVSRHDAVVSVRAGFSRNELSLLWPGRRGWSLEEREAGPFTHAFVARRGAAPGAE